MKANMFYRQTEVKIKFQTVLEIHDKKLIKKGFSAYYFLKAHLHHFSKIKSQTGAIKQ